MMIKKLMAVASIAFGVCAGSLVTPTTAKALSPSEYAVEQCGNGGWEQKQYPTYEECYMAAVQYYIEQGFGGGGGGGGITVPWEVPGWTPGSGCGATRLPCNPGD